MCPHSLCSPCRINRTLVSKAFCGNYSGLSFELFSKAACDFFILGWCKAAFILNLRLTHASFVTREEPCFIKNVPLL